MYRARFGVLFPLAILLVTPFLWTPLASARDDGRWTLSLGGGLADQFTYRTYSYDFGDFPERFPVVPHAFFAVGHRVGRHFVALTQAGYAGYGEDLSIVSIPEVRPPASHLGVQVMSLGLGLRYYPGALRAMRPKPYVQLLPTFYATRWMERNEYAAGPDFWGNYQPARVAEDSFTSLRPGFEAGVGLVGPLLGPTHLDVGLTYRYSANVGERSLGEFSSGEFDGLRQLGIAAALQWSW